MKIVYIDRESLHMFLTARVISIKFSGKMRLTITLKVTENEGFSLSLEDTFFWKTTGGIVQIDPPTFLGLS